MEKEFVSYENALVLKELGFNEPCLAVYNDPDFKWVRHLNGWEDSELDNVTNTKFGSGGFVTAPLYQQAFRWFREKYGYLPNIYNFDGNFKATLSGNCNWLGSWTRTYEEAELSCLKELIEIARKR